MPATSVVAWVRHSVRDVQSPLGSVVGKKDRAGLPHVSPARGLTAPTESGAGTLCKEPHPAPHLPMSN